MYLLKRNFCLKMIPLNVVKALLLASFLLDQISGFAQAFTAESGDLYATDDPLKYNCGVTVLTGTMRITDKIDFYSPKGTKFSATILEMTQDYNPVNEIKAGQYGQIVVKFSQGFSGVKDYPTYKSKILPSGSAVQGVVIEDKDDKSKYEFTSRLNNKDWNAKVSYKGALLGRNGFKPLNINKPCLQLQFSSVMLPDNRTLTLQVFYPKEIPAKYSAKDLEVLFIGSEAGEPGKSEMYGFVNGEKFPNFTLEIKEWKSIDNSKAIISGKIEGELPEISIIGRSNKKVKFENGVFENVKVEIIDE